MNTESNLTFTSNKQATQHKIEWRHQSWSSVMTVMIVSNHCLEDVGHIGHLIPHPSNCSNYFQCVGGNPILMSCPEGQSYDANLKACSDEDETACVKLSTNKEEDDNQILEEQIICPEEISKSPRCGTCCVYRLCIASCAFQTVFDVGQCMRRCRDQCCKDNASCCGCAK